MTDNEDLLRIGFIGVGELATWAILPTLHFAPIRLQAVCDLDKIVVPRGLRISLGYAG